MCVEYLVRVVFEVGDDGDEDSIFLTVPVPLDRSCTIKEFINDFVKNHTHLEFAEVFVFSFVDSFLLD